MPLPRRSCSGRRPPACRVAEDTEDYDFIEYTVVVKLTKDVDGEEPSAMRVVGATNSFYYAKEAGAAGAFRARVHHASCAPQHEAEHLKVAFFFRAAPKGERRAQRQMAAEVCGARIECETSLCLF